MQGASVYSLVVSENTVYAGGDFINIGGQTRGRIAALDGTTGPKPHGILLLMQGFKK